MIIFLQGTLLLNHLNRWIFLLKLMELGKNYIIYSSSYYHIIIIWLYRVRGKEMWQ